MIKAEDVVDFTPDDNYFEQLSKRLGAGAAEAAVKALTEAAVRGTASIR